jgi:hypothetical protein
MVGYQRQLEGKDGGVKGIRGEAKQPNTRMLSGPNEFEFSHNARACSTRSIAHILLLALLA